MSFDDPSFGVVPVCYTTVVKTVKINVVYKYIIFEEYSYTDLWVIMDDQYGRSKYTTYINEWMTR